jgi:mannose-1-phosphate guanylyltransferase/mannose-6-phosphate isomerase
VILSGGSGTRLWPLSTRHRPKQFADLIPGSPTLFEGTLGRLQAQAPIVVTGFEHLELVRDAAKRLGVVPHLVIVEPDARNTGPAVAAAALCSDPEEVLVLLPADHLIGDDEAFRSHVADAVTLAETGSIVTFGVRPSRPETGYGYIQVAEPVGAGFRVERFKEKPSHDEAQLLVADHLWNSGMFVATAGVLLAEMEQICPALLAGVKEALTPIEQGLMRLSHDFAAVEAISFDHAVMEHTERASVIPIDVGWDDVGSFQSLMTHMAKDAEGNAVAGDVILDQSSGSFVHATSRLVVVSGLRDVVVVETPDAVLVVPLEDAQSVKSLAERANRGR